MNIAQKLKKQRKNAPSKEEMKYIYNNSRMPKRNFKDSDPALVQIAKIIKKKGNKCRIGQTQIRFLTQIIDWDEQFKQRDDKIREARKISPRKRPSSIILVDLLNLYAEIVNKKQNPQIEKESKDLIIKLNKDVAEFGEKIQYCEKSNPYQTDQGDTISKKRKISEIKEVSKQQNISNNNSQESTMSDSRIQIIPEEDASEPNKNSVDGMNCEQSTIYPVYSTECFDLYDFDGYFDINNCYEPSKPILYELENEIEKQISFDLDSDPNSNSYSIIASQTSDGTIEYRQINQNNTYQEISDSFVNVSFECNLRDHPHSFEAKIIELGLNTQECEKQRNDLEEQFNSYDQFQHHENIKDIGYYKDNNNTISIFNYDNSVDNEEHPYFTQDTSLFPPTDACISYFQDQYYVKKKTYCASCCGVLEDYENEWYTTKYLDETCQCTRTNFARVPGG